jgi:hypothetical protein
MGPKIVCVCVTQAKRAPVFGIAAASFAQQDYADKHLLIDLPSSDRLTEHAEVLQRLVPNEHYVDTTSWLLHDADESVPARLDRACKYAFDIGAADLCTIWDDDDIKPTTWLQAIEMTNWYEPCAFLAGSTQGWFCNLRTLNGQFLELPHLWGGSLTFNRAAWEAAGGFAGKPWPGQDQAFARAIKDSGVLTLCTELNVDKDHAGHVAMSPGDNVATWLTQPGVPLAASLREWYGDTVAREVERAAGWLIERRIFPPYSGDN